MTLPSSLQLPKRALVAYQLAELLPPIMVFQYNPGQLARALQGRTARIRRWGDTRRTDGPLVESIFLWRGD
jgi:hypothetical protein